VIAPLKNGGHNAIPISAHTAAARKNGRKPLLSSGAPRHARDAAAERLA